MFELKSVYNLNVLINVKLRYTCLKFVWLVDFCWSNVKMCLSEPVNTFLFYFYLSRGACLQDLYNMIAYTSCRPLLRPCNKYILNTERKVFNYLWLYILVESLKKNMFFRLGKRCKIYKNILQNMPLNVLKCSYPLE